MQIPGAIRSPRSGDRRALRGDRSERERSGSATARVAPLRERGSDRGHPSVPDRFRSPRSGHPVALQRCSPIAPPSAPPLLLRRSALPAGWSLSLSLPLRFRGLDPPDPHSIPPSARHPVCNPLKTKGLRGEVPGVPAHPTTRQPPQRAAPSRIDSSPILRRNSSGWAVTTVVSTSYAVGRWGC